MEDEGSTCVFFTYYKLGHHLQQPCSPVPLEPLKGGPGSSHALTRTRLVEQHRILCLIDKPQLASPSSFKARIVGSLSYISHPVDFLIRDLHSPIGAEGSAGVQPFAAALAALLGVDLRWLYKIWGLAEGL